MTENTFQKTLRDLGIDPAHADDRFRAAHPFAVALRYAAMGFRVFPANKWKVPLIPEFQFKASTEPQQLVQWERGYFTPWNIAEAHPNWCLLTGRDNNVVVFDIDGDAGRGTLSRLESKLGPLPEKTWRVSSGRLGGGEHILLRPPAGIDDLRNQQPVTVDGIQYKGVDVRGWHGFVAIAGNLHKSGNRYGWLPGCSPDEVAMAECPASWWAWLPKREHGDNAIPRHSGKRVASSAGVQRRHDPGSLLIGDGFGGFQNPIYKNAISYFFKAGIDAPAEPIIGTLRELVIEAPKDHGRDVSRYVSGPDLPRIVERARSFVIKVKDTENE